jgi:hypothetical protein
MLCLHMAGGVISVPSPHRPDLSMPLHWRLSSQHEWLGNIQPLALDSACFFLLSCISAHYSLYQEYLCTIFRWLIPSKHAVDVLKITSSVMSSVLSHLV